MLNGEFDAVASSRYDPNVMRKLIAGDRFTELLDGLNDTAPAEIAADVQAETEWFRTRWSDVVAEFDYDLRAHLSGRHPRGSEQPDRDRALAPRAPAAANGLLFVAVR